MTSEDLHLSHRKLLTVIMEAGLEVVVPRELKRLGATGYTITEASGQGSRGVRAATWEADRNVRLEVLCSEQTGRAILAHLYEKYYENYAMVAFMQDVDVLRPEKF